MIRVSATTVETFRLWRDPDQDWLDESDLIASIKGVFEPTDAVRLGLAFGKVLEDPDKYLVPGGYRCGAHSFSLATIDPALALIDRRGVFEAKAVKTYGPIDVVAKADHLLGSHLSEFKTTVSTFDFDKYAASCQWRFMTDIFEPSRITYHVFILDDHGNGVADLKSIETFSLFPYAALHQDCCDLLAQFVDFVTVKDLDGILRARQEAA